MVCVDSRLSVRDRVNSTALAFGFASSNFFTSLLAAIEVEKNHEKYFGKVVRDPPLLLTGPQHSQPRLREALRSWNISGTVGLVSAGWEEDEFDDAWVRDAVDNTVVNSHLYEFGEQLFVEDPEIIYLLRRRQDELRKLREVNKIQLDHLLATARELLRREFAGEEVLAETDTTFRQIREVDALYIDHVYQVIRKYDKQIEPTSRATVLGFRQRVLEQLDGCQALFIAGGHIGVLLNRLNLSRLLRHVNVPVIAWSGGAMAMGDKIVFYHHFIPHSSGANQYDIFNT